ncbi:hypothetical protein DBB36_20425 [Flavobacterium sp. WLB]|uniref:Uncharacterized protein n=1 Tax=Flavobacterium panici TaxID=2654843 RepID=A0A9N8J012_9FLAO|nr:MULTISPECIES: hypothetical protein [Flavobacterium]KOP39150.1 hypothetical protein AKO67_06265 [Flavobacterium sp. VMW]OWU89191.1 hypothetical protein APR43_18490 [Flavobacterium sp. NLM]PUU68144.1 hypothetical protein DBB36_20425 [Flavobacterium sp. WLB]CAC9972867.1 hypothetical protein FLAPXU55_00546 [Flavobacterium panici]
MGIFDFLKTKKVNDETFNSSQFQNEILAFALWKFNETNDYYKVEKELWGIQDFDLSEKQIKIIIEKLKVFNEKKN